MLSKRKRVVNKINRALEMPEEVILEVPKLTIMQFKEILIENYTAILEYQDFYIRIKTNIGIININGYSLSLEEMTSDDIMVKGKIESIDFESIED